MREKQELYSLERAAESLKVSPEYLKDCINFEVIEGFKENGKYFIPKDNLSRYIKLKDVAKLLSISTRTARRYEKEGLLKSYTFKNDLSFKLSDVEEFEKKSQNKKRVE